MIVASSSTHIENILDCLHKQQFFHTIFLSNTLKKFPDVTTNTCCGENHITSKPLQEMRCVITLLFHWKIYFDVISNQLFSKLIQYFRPYMPYFLCLVCVHYECKLQIARSDSDVPQNLKKWDCAGHSNKTVAQKYDIFFRSVPQEQYGNP